MTHSVLIVEDERHLAEGLRFNLEAESYRVEVAADGETALALLTAPDARFDAVVLDVMLPGKDGFEVANELRRAGEYVPILMLTARGHPEDVLRGFAAGADDYLPKPFELAILLARLRGLLRRSAWGRSAQAGGVDESVPVKDTNSGDDDAANAAEARATEDKVFVFDDKAFDFGALELRAGARVIRLTLMEAKLLRHLIERNGRIVSRKSLLEEVWGLHEDTDTRAIDNFIVRLRKLIEDEPSRPKHLLTVRGVGYRFVAV